MTDIEPEPEPEEVADTFAATERRFIEILGQHTAPDAPPPTPNRAHTWGQDLGVGPGELRNVFARIQQPPRLDPDELATTWTWGEARAHATAALPPLTRYYHPTTPEPEPAGAAPEVSDGLANAFCMYMDMLTDDDEEDTPSGPTFAQFASILSSSDFDAVARLFPGHDNSVIAELLVELANLIASGSGHVGISLYWG